MNQTMPEQHYNTPTQVKITLVRSLLGRPEKHRRVAIALGLKKTQDIAIHYNSPTIQGMISKISHLLSVEAA